MFLHPSSSSFPKDISLAPACGLYLADIHYNAEDLALPDDINEQIDGKTTVQNSVATEGDRNNS